MITARDVKGKVRNGTESEELVGKARSERLIECVSRGKRQWADFSRLVCYLFVCDLERHSL